MTRGKSGKLKIRSRGYKAPWRRSRRRGLLAWNRHPGKHYVVSKCLGFNLVEMPAPFGASRQPRLGPIPRSQELRRAICGMEKLVMKDLVLISQGGSNSRPSECHSKGQKRQNALKPFAYNVFERSGKTYKHQMCLDCGYIKCFLCTGSTRRAHLMTNYDLPWSFMFSPYTPAGSVATSRRSPC